MKNLKHIVLLLLLWLLLLILWFCAMVELTTLVSYRHFFTSGELFAWVTANRYEVSDIASYCMRYVLPYWVIGSVFFMLGAWLIWRTVRRGTKKQIWVCGLTLTAILLPFTVLPLHCNLLRETAYVIQQVRNIRTHQSNNRDYTYNAIKKDTIQSKQIYVLSIGESLRYRNLSLNGTYPRRTTPLLERQPNLCLYSDFYANATLTQHALPLLFTLVYAADFNEHFCHKMITAAFAETGFKTALVSHRAQLMNNGYHDYLAQDFDTVVWVEHDSLIAPAMTNMARKEQHLFVVTHYLGNHMFYTNRTADCLVWRPDYNADRKSKSDSLFLNAYDNSVLYTDKLLSECLDSLRTLNAVASCLFLSDHGEYISPKVSGHGHTYHPTIDEYHVPLMVWYSDDYAAACPEKVVNLEHHKNEPVCADHVFWSVLDMAGIQIDCTLQQEGMSIFGDTLLPHKRTLLLPDGKSIMDLD